MLRVYKMPNGRTYRYEEGKQPSCAVLVEKAAAQKVETPEARASKAASQKRAAKPKKAEED